MARGKGSNSHKKQNTGRRKSTREKAHQALVESDIAPDLDEETLDRWGVLTDREMAFAMAYAGHQNPTVKGIMLEIKGPDETDDAAARRGYYMYGKPQVRAEIIRRLEQRGRAAGWDRERVIATTSEVINRAMQAAPVFDAKGNRVFVETPNGEVAAAFAFDPKAALAGLDQMAGYLGMHESNADKALRALGALREFALRINDNAQMMPIATQQAREVGE